MPVRPSAPFVGRSAEMERLRALLGDAARGDPRLAVVVGDSGVGKTRLLDALGEAAAEAEQAATVLRGRCAPVIGGGLPYASVTAALRSLLGHLDGAAVDDEREAVQRWPALQVLAPSGRERVTTPTPSRTALFESVLGLVAAEASRRPVLMVLDDVQWADPSTLDLVGFLACNLVHERFLLVLALRPEALLQGHALQRPLAEVARLPLSERIDVAPLSRDELATLAAVMTGRELTDPELDVLADRSGGVPFLVQELLVSDRDAGRLHGVPSTIVEMLTAELGDLPRETRRLLAIAALAGREVDDELLAAVGDETLDRVSELLEPAFHTRVLVLGEEGDAMAFRHDLLREVAMATLLPGERRRLHGRLADAVGAVHRGGRPEAELAYHCERAGRAREALTASLHAAAHARSMSAPGDVALHLERVLRLWDSVSDAERLAGAGRAELARQVADCHWTTGDPAAAAQWAVLAHAETEDTTDAQARAVAAAYLALYLFNAGEPDRSGAVLRTAADETAAVPGAGRAAVLAVLAASQALAGDCRAALRTCDEAVAIAGRDEAVRLHARTTRAGARVALGEVDAGLAELEDVIALATGAVAARVSTGPAAGELHDAGVTLARAVNNYAFLLLAHGWSGRALALVGEGLATVEDRRLGVGYRSHLAGLRALALVVQGDTAQARRALDDLPRLPPSRMTTTAVQARIALGLLSGDLETAARHLVPGISELDVMSPLAIELALGRGDLQGAADIAAGRVAWLQERGIGMHGARVAGLGLQAQARLLARAHRDGSAEDRTRSVDRLRMFLDAARGFGEQSTAGGAMPPETAAWTALAEAEAAAALHGLDDPRNLAAWSRATEVVASTDLRPLALRTGMGLASALLAVGDRDGAAARLSATRSAAALMGAAPVLQAVDDLGRRARLDLRRAQPPQGASARLGITERELEVLRALADGLTNREIGERLFISAKTASVHVSNLLRKLEVPHRRAAASRARELGLLALPSAE